MVNVLVSTYNGEQYIREQLDSILDQTYPDIRIYVRDDGSTDGTMKILWEYSERDEIRLIKGRNVGYGRSFLRLLKIAKEGDYWCFCDQDDVWLPDKVKWAVEWLETQPTGVPALFGNAYELTDETLEKSLGEVLPPKYALNFRRALTDCVYMGFAMTINGPLRALMLEADINQITSHDWWAQILAERFGVHHFDDRIAVKHRRLDTSISGMSMKNRFKWLGHTLRTGDTGIRSCARAYTEAYGTKMNDRAAKYAKWFSSKHYRPDYALLKALYPGRWRPALSSEAVLRLLMLLGRV